MESRFETANNIAAQSHMDRENIRAGKFTLALWKKIKYTSAPKGPIQIYIEGDGLARLDGSTPSEDPTPLNPAAFKLASEDPAPNVIYIARPCQYTMKIDNDSCDVTYWTDKRYAPEIIASYNTALDHIKSQYNVTGFHLIGFSGGANIAGLLAQERNDILTLRTVSGNIDTDYFNRLHHVVPVEGSLNMATKANQLAHLPQRHFIGGKDIITPYSVFQNYLNAVGPSNCIAETYVSQATHTQGWAENWKTLLNLSVNCSHLSQ